MTISLQVREHLPLLTRCATRDVEIRPYTELYLKFLVRNTAIKIIVKLNGFPKQIEVEINYIAGKILEHQSVYLTNKQTNQDTIENGNNQMYFNGERNKHSV